MSKNKITFQVSGEEHVPADAFLLGTVTPETKLYITEGPIPSKVICDHAEDCESMTCGHKKSHKFQSETCEFSNGKPITCAAIDKVVKCIADPVGQRLDIMEKAIEVLRGLERRTVCPACFHLRKSGHSYKCEIMKLLDDYDNLG